MTLFDSESIFVFRYVIPINKFGISPCTFGMADLLATFISHINKVVIKVQKKVFTSGRIKLFF